MFRHFFVFSLKSNLKGKFDTFSSCYLAPHADRGATSSLVDSHRRKFVTKLSIDIDDIDALHLLFIIDKILSNNCHRFASEAIAIIHFNSESIRNHETSHAVISNVQLMHISLIIFVYVALIFWCIESTDMTLAVFLREQSGGRLNKRVVLAQIDSCHAIVFRNICAFDITSSSIAVPGITVSVWTIPAEVVCDIFAAVPRRDRVVYAIVMHIEELFRIGCVVGIAANFDLYPVLPQMVGE